MAFLVVGATAYANSSSMVGKKVQNEAPVVLNGDEFAKAVIIDGVSYLPVRTISNALNVEVEFKEGKVILNNESKKLALKINLLDIQIKFNKDGIDTANMLIDMYTGYIEVEPHRKAEYNVLISQAQADITEYETTIRELEKQREVLIAESAAK